MFVALHIFTTANKVMLIALSFGGIFCLIGYKMTPSLFDEIIARVVDEILVLSPSTDFYKTWAEPEIPVIQRFYFFDIQNPEEIMNGGTPRVLEKGPYAYSVKLNPVNITFNGNSTLSFRKHMVFTFEPEFSSGSEDDVITTVNFPLATSAASVKYSNWWARLGVSAIAQIHNQGVFTKKSVKSLLWGYKDPLLKQLQTLVGKDMISSDEFGFLLGQNDTDSLDVYTIHTGENDPTLLNTVTRFNGETSLPWWSDEYANMINGTDTGTFFHANIHPEEILHVFNPVMCRSIPFIHDENIDANYDGVPILHYHMAEYVYANPSEYPPNSGFCVDGLCSPTGIFNVSACAMGVPMALSHPHFLYAADEVLHSINGLQPSKIKHESQMGIEPIMGIPYIFDHRVQINVYMEEIDGIRQTRNIPSLYYPMMWLETHGEMPDDIVNQYKTNIAGSYDLVDTVQQCCLVLGCVICGCFMGFIVLASVRLRRNNKLIQEKLTDIEKAQKESFLSNIMKTNTQQKTEQTEINELSKPSPTHDTPHDKLHGKPQDNANDDREENTNEDDHEKRVMLYKTSSI